MKGISHLLRRNLRSIMTKWLFYELNYSCTLVSCLLKLILLYVRLCRPFLFVLARLKINYLFPDFEVVLFYFTFVYLCKSINSNTVIHSYISFYTLNLRRRCSNQNQKLLHISSILWILNTTIYADWMTKYFLLFIIFHKYKRTGFAIFCRTCQYYFIIMHIIIIPIINNPNVCW